ncbi:putative lysozyme-like domain protein [Acinetobacter phage phiAC-1]|uniref:putative lysozyme-like domain protein n=1 Tax=Acinetobacter phage phiAC-1 TaxID=1229760 RepID=UPI00028AD29E|nr:putative lysozyme-like domain protein [Acinetobacter phage phiAC-1]AFU62306.1 putative lysozyme-like domain protein [Acinetobacter phage phiAC-1]
MAENIVESIIVKLGLDGSQYNREADKAVGKNKKLTESVSETDKVVGNVTKTLARWFSVAAAATGLIKLVDQVQQLNDELYFLERNLGMSSQTIKNWQGAASAMGGSAQGMTESMKSLNMGMNDFVVMGDTTLLPFMNALGVSMVDTQGHLRKTDDVMLDLADSFSKMDREQAFSIASKMGIDEGTFNTLVQGRQEMEKMIAYQNTMYKSSEAELQASRDLAKNRAANWFTMGIT